LLIVQSLKRLSSLLSKAHYSSSSARHNSQKQVDLHQYSTTVKLKTPVPNL